MSGQQEEHVVVVVTTAVAGARVVELAADQAEGLACLGCGRSVLDTVLVPVGVINPPGLCGALATAYMDCAPGLLVGAAA